MSEPTAVLTGIGAFIFAFGFVLGSLIENRMSLREMEDHRRNLDRLKESDRKLREDIDGMLRQVAEWKAQRGAE